MGKTRRILASVLLVMAALAVAPAQPASADPSWWDNNYSHRRGITIAAADALANGYTIEVTINHAALVSSGQSLTSGNDVRIVRWTGAAWVELDRVLQVGSSWNNASTKIYFRTQAAISAGAMNSQYYVYYGYASAGAPPVNKDNVFHFQDDFDAGSINTTMWTEREQANTTVTQTGGELVVTGNNMGAWDYSGLNANFGYDSIPNSTVEVTISMVSQDNLVWNDSRVFNGVEFNGLFLTSAGSTTRTIQGNNSGRGNTVLTSAQTFSNVRSKYFRAVDGTSKYWENGSLLTTWQGPASTAYGLRVGMGANNGGAFEIHFDDLTVRKTVLNEPSVILEATSDMTVAIAVDPTLTFTVGSHAGACNGVSQSTGTSSSGTAVSLGRVTSSANNFAAQDLTVGTNAANGYTVFARYSGTMNDGAGHNITDWTGSNASPTATWAAGNTYFGYTVDDATLSPTANRFTNGGAKFAAMTTTNSEVHYGSGTASNDVNCIGYQVGISAATPAGSYSTTVIYTAVPLF